MEQENVKNMTTEELKEALAERTKNERAQKAKEKATYERDRDLNISVMVNVAAEIYEDLIVFKEEAQTMMNKQYDILANYGGIRKGSKGGFSLINKEGTLKIVRRRDTQPVWDERSQKAVALIEEFLGDKIKKRSRKQYEILMTFIKRNEKGHLEYDRVMTLIQHKDKYTDERWLKGLELITESYSVHMKGYAYDFFVKNDQEKWDKINLNFSAI